MVVVQRLPWQEVLMEIAATGNDAFGMFCSVHPPKVVLARYRKMVLQGYLDYGVSITKPWLTDKGRAALEDIR